MRFKFLDILLFVLLLVFVSCFPYDRLGLSYLIEKILAIGFRLCVLAYYLYIIVKNQIKVFGISNRRNIIICIPFLIACFSNMIAFKIDGGTFYKETINFPVFFVEVLLVFISALLEEIVFRLFIHNSLTEVGSIKRILGSAGIFALMHLINVVNVASINDLVALLIQVVYTFGLGLMLGFLYEFSHSLTACVFLHFLFNFFNSLLLRYFYPEVGQLPMYLTAVVIAFVLVCYSLLIYLSNTQRLLIE